MPAINLVWFLSGCSFWTPPTEPAVEPTPAADAKPRPTPEPAPPAGPIAAAKAAPKDSPLLVWSNDESAEIAGRLVAGAWQHDFDIPVDELKRLVVEGQPTTTSGGSGAFGSGPRWDCDRFVVSLKEPIDPQVVLAAAPSWDAFPRALVDHELSDGEKARLNAVIEGAGGKGSPEIDRASGVDLDGDGHNELMVPVTTSTLTTRFYNNGEAPRDGDYAGLVVLNGATGDGHWVGTVSEPKNTMLYLDDVRVATVADLDGDGQLELFVRWSNTNWGTRVELYRWTAQNLTSLGTVAYAGESDCSDAPREGWGEP